MFICVWYSIYQPFTSYLNRHWKEKKRYHIWEVFHIPWRYVCPSYVWFFIIYKYICLLTVRVWSAVGFFQYCCLRWCHISRHYFILYRVTLIVSTLIIFIRQESSPAWTSFKVIELEEVVVVRGWCSVEFVSDKYSFEELIHRMVLSSCLPSKL